VHVPTGTINFETSLGGFICSKALFTIFLGAIVTFAVGAASANDELSRIVAGPERWGDAGRRPGQPVTLDQINATNVGKPQVRVSLSSKGASLLGKSRVAEPVRNKQEKWSQWTVSTATRLIGSYLEEETVAAASLRRCIRRCTAARASPLQESSTARTDAGHPPIAQTQ
jgi:hypothetical protein